MLNPVDNFVEYREGTTSPKKNSKKINLGKKMIWHYGSLPDLGVNIFYCVLRELRWIKQINGVRVIQGKVLFL